MIIRRAKEQDIPDMHRLLGQVEMVHHVGRPDLFKYKAFKYNNEELAELIKDDSLSSYNDPQVPKSLHPKSLGITYTFCAFSIKPHL